MAQFVVRNLDDDVKTALQKRARAHGRSMEEEIRQILRHAVHDRSEVLPGVGTRMAARFADDGLDDALPELRGQMIDPLSMER